jgi:hypothetical protein
MSTDTTLQEIAFQDLPHYLVQELVKYGVVMIGIDRKAWVAGQIVRSNDA